jgi:hypothetical protein
MLAEAKPEDKAAVAKAEPFTMNSTTPVGELPDTVAVAVKAAPNGIELGTPDNVVVVAPRLPELTVMT